MFSQSLSAQLIRMSLLLAMCLCLVQFSPTLRDFIAAHAIDSGCHQGGGEHHHATHAHHSHH